MANKAVCRICAEYLKPNDDMIRVVRENGKQCAQWYHTACFEVEAGDYYVPKIETIDSILGHMTKQMAAQIDKEIMGHFKQREDMVLTEEQLNKYMHDKIPNFYYSANYNVAATETMILNDLQKRVPMGIKIDVEVRRDPMSEMVGVTVRYVGNKVYEQRAILHPDMGYRKYV